MIREDEPTVPPHASPALQQLLRRMLAKRPEQRPSLHELRTDPWVTAMGAHPLPHQDCGEMVPTETADPRVRPPAVAAAAGRTPRPPSGRSI